MQERFCLLGWGKVTQALARVLSHFHPTSDIFVLNEIEDQLELSRFKSGVLHSMKKVEGGFDEFDWSEYLPAQVFLSPGIDPRRKFFKKLENFEVREMDYFCDHFPGIKIGITGTDGKSTFTTQLGEALKRHFPEKKVFVGGNLGRASAEALAEAYDIAVIELSSYQCERLKRAHFDFGILLNLAPDHLDRYNRLEDYYQAKWSLIDRSTRRFFPEDVKSQSSLMSEARYQNNSDLSEILFKIAPVIVRELQGVFRSELLDHLPELPHRFQIYEDSKSSLFINDSKATTVHSALYAYRHFKASSRKVFWIIGGKSKGEDYSALLQELKATDEFVIVGEARHELESIAQKLKKAFRSYSTLREALAEVLPVISSVEVLLLSPACASFDEFENFEDRGEVFLRSIEKIRGPLKKVSKKHLNR